MQISYLNDRIVRKFLACLYYCEDMEPCYIYNMKIILDLEGVVNKVTLFETISNQLIIKNWGNNWDALNDCLRDLDSGGFTKKYDFPLNIELINWRQFELKNPVEFKSFKEVLNNQVKEHGNDKKELTVSFE